MESKVKLVNRNIEESNTRKPTAELNIPRQPSKYSLLQSSQKKPGATDFVQMPKVSCRTNLNSSLAQRASRS